MYNKYRFSIRESIKRHLSAGHQDVIEQMTTANTYSRAFLGTGAAETPESKPVATTNTRASIDFMLEYITFNEKATNDINGESRNE